jgi:transcriptional regulator with GAF, ATPase, and Fis domain
VLQEHEFERLGGTRTLKVDVRLIAATNRNLAQMVSSGQFREDLYYRLNVVSIEMPPLRERKDDIPALAEFFVRRFSGELKKKMDNIHPEAAKMLLRYNWPGNIRELENAIERAVLLTEGSQIKPDDLRLGEVSTSGGDDSASIVKIPPSGISLEEIEKRALIEALKMSNWVQKDAAELLQISARVINYKIKTLGIEFPKARRPMMEAETV